MKTGTTSVKTALATLFLFGAAHLAADLPLVQEQHITMLKDSTAPRNIRLHRITRRPDKPIIERGTLFTLKARNNNSVKIAGDFTGWKPVSMQRGAEGVWFYFLPAGDESTNPSYKFLVDGVWTSDPANPDEKDDRFGSMVSVTSAPAIAEGSQVTYRIVSPGTVQFRHYHPDARFISVVGDFNNWNPENDLLSRGPDNIWRLTRRLPAGTYRYRFVIDGTWLPDTYNRISGSDDNGEVCSLLTIK